MKTLKEKLVRCVMIPIDLFLFTSVLTLLKVSDVVHYTYKQFSDD